MQSSLQIDDSDEVGAENEADLDELDATSAGEVFVTSTDWTTETILNQLNRGNIELNPRFQRRDAWTGPRKSAFIESLFLGLPIPQIVLAERRDRRGSYVVIDGKQRLLALRQYSAGDGDLFTPLRLARLEIRSDLNGMTLRELRESGQYVGDLDRFDNETIRTVVVRNWPDDAFLYLVFLRLNTGSVSLNAQELRQALNPGPFIDFVDDYSIQSDALQQALRLKGPDRRMRDVEILIRYFAFAYFLPNYAGNLKRFLDETCRSLNERWQDEEIELREAASECEAAIGATQSIFEGDAFNRWSGESFEGRFNRAVFDIMVYYFKDASVADAAVQLADRVKQAFVDLASKDPRFDGALTATTKSIEATYVRLAAWGEALENTLGLKLPVPTLNPKTNRIHYGAQ